MLLSKVHQILLCRTGLLALLVAATMSVSALSAEEEAQTRSDRLLPPGVLLHIRISDVSDMKERLPQTGFGKLYADKSMDKVRGKIEEAFAKAYAEAGKELGFPLTDLLNIPSGEVSFSLLQPAGRSLAGVVMMDIGDEKETLDKALAKLDEALTSKGAKKKSETIEEVEVTVYDIPKDGNGGGDESSA